VTKSGSTGDCVALETIFSELICALQAHPPNNSVTIPMHWEEDGTGVSVWRTALRDMLQRKGGRGGSRTRRSGLRVFRASISGQSLSEAENRITRGTTRDYSEAAVVGAGSLSKRAGPPIQYSPLASAVYGLICAGLDVIALRAS
jgi:hypothetical protein